MGWQEDVVIPKGAEPAAEAVDALLVGLRSGEQPVVAFRTHRLEMSGYVARFATVVVTNQRLLVAKEKTFGRPKLSKSVDLEDVIGSGFGPLLGVGPTWEVGLNLRHGGVASIYFDGPHQCEPVENAIRRAATGQAESVGPPRPVDGSPPPEVQERVKRNYSFLKALRPLAATEMVGQPFGEGFGLEDALAVVPSHFPNASELRESHQMLAVELLMATGKTFEPDDLDEIMGTNERAFQSFEISPSQFGAVTSLAGAARTFLGQFDDDGGNMWELWKSRDDVAAEFLCWHAVALLRLARVGKMPSIADALE